MLHQIDVLPDPFGDYDFTIETVSLADLVEVTIKLQDIEVFANHATSTWKRETKPVRTYRRILYPRLQNDTTAVSDQIDEALRSQLQVEGFQFGTIRYSQKFGSHVLGLKNGHPAMFRWRPHTYHPNCGELVMYDCNRARRRRDGRYEVEFLKLG